MERFTYGKIHEFIMTSKQVTTTEVTLAPVRGFLGTDSFRNPGSEERDYAFVPPFLREPDVRRQGTAYCLSAPGPSCHTGAAPCGHLFCCHPAEGGDLSAEDAGGTLQEEAASPPGPSVLSYLSPWSTMAQSVHRALSAPQGTVSCSPALA